MQVLNNGFNPLSKLQKLSSNFNTLNFKVLNQPDDSFELSYETKLQKFENAKSLNPNTAFLYNPDLSYEDKVKELKKHPEIMQIGDVVSGFKFSSIDVGDDIFALDILDVPARGKNRKKSIRLIDTSFENNKDAIDALNENKNNLIGFSRFRAKYDLSKGEFFKNLKLGRFERFSLNDDVNKQGKPSRIIDLSSEKNIQTLSNLDKLDNHSKILSKLLSAERGEKIYVDISQLADFGISDFETITKAIEEEKIEGRISTTTDEDGNEKQTVKINLNSQRAQKFLKYLRSKQCMRADLFAKKYNIPMSEIEDAFFEGKIDFYPKALLPTDWGDRYVDLKSEKNIDYFNKILLQKELEKEILKKKTNDRLSLRMKLTWFLAPNTRAVAKELADGNNYLSYIISKKERIEAQSELIEKEPDALIEENIDETETLSQQEIATLKAFYKDMWDKAGTEEYKQALKQASSVLRQVDKYGLDSVEDAEIRKFLKQNMF